MSRKLCWRETWARSGPVRLQVRAEGTGDWAGVILGSVAVRAVQQVFYLRRCRGSRPRSTAGYPATIRCSASGRGILLPGREARLRERGRAGANSTGRAHRGCLAARPPSITFGMPELIALPVDSRQCESITVSDQLFAFAVVGVRETKLPVVQLSTPLVLVGAVTSTSVTQVDDPSLLD
jgi:hypothetical protein